MQVFVVINKGVIKINADVNVKNWLIKVDVMKNSFRILVTVIVNVINHMIWDSTLIDYKNCKCRKKLSDKLVEECSKNIDGNCGTLNGYEKVFNSCTIYKVLLVIVF